MPRPLRPTPARMLNAILEFLEEREEWGSQEWNDLAELIAVNGYSEPDGKGGFKAKKCADIEQGDLYAKGWEAGRRAARIEAAMGVKA